MIIILILSCGQSIQEITNFSSEETCKDQIPAIRAGFVGGANPTIVCVKK